MSELILSKCFKQANLVRRIKCPLTELICQCQCYRWYIPYNCPTSREILTIYVLLSEWKRKSDEIQCSPCFDIFNMADVAQFRLQLGHYLNLKKMKWYKLFLTLKEAVEFAKFIDSMNRSSCWCTRLIAQTLLFFSLSNQTCVICMY